MTPCNRTVRKNFTTLITWNYTVSLNWPISSAVFSSNCSAVSWKKVSHCSPVWSAVLTWRNFKFCFNIFLWTQNIKYCSQECSGIKVSNTSHPSKLEQNKKKGRGNDLSTTFTFNQSIHVVHRLFCINGMLIYFLLTLIISLCLKSG